MRRWTTCDNEAVPAESVLIFGVFALMLVYGAGRLVHLTIAFALSHQRPRGALVIPVTAFSAISLIGAVGVYITLPT